MIPVGAIEDNLPPDRWVLILGGLTREGNRRSRRAARTALASDLSVVWFDGFEEVSVDDSGRRVPLEAIAPDGSPMMVVVGYAGRVKSHWLNRMVDLPASLEKPFAGLERRMDRRGMEAVHSTATRVRRSVAGVGRLIRKKILSRISLILRGRLVWRLVRDDLRVLAEAADPPVQIVFGDDFALTQAWHAARMWRDVPTGMELVEL